MDEELNERMVTAGSAEPGDTVGTRVAEEIVESTKADAEENE